MMKHAHGGIAHFDVAGPELEAQKTFYETLFGWSVDVKGPGYALVQTPDEGLRGAFIEQGSASLHVGVTVQDLDATLEEAVRLGGKVIMPAVDNGWVKKAQISDRAGNVLTVIQM